jgi:hypothetical protein
MTESNVATEYKPGDEVKASGIYRVTHDRNHVAAHEVTCVYGRKFPPCNGCGHHPRFVLVHAAIHVESNENFR